MTLYVGKVMLAPMVHVCTLPVRILALRYGAQLVYSDEIIDHGLIRAKRVENDNTNTVEYIDYLGKVVFSTNIEEKGKVILQIGTNNPERALTAAKSVEKDVAGIDVNMGCPKDFSTDFGMGSALLSNPSNAHAILKKLVENLSVPVTCKIRIQPSLDDTLRFAELMASTGIAAIAVHGRTRYERPKDPDHPDIVKKISDSLDIPVIASGGSLRIKKFEDIAKFQEEVGCQSVMIARAASWNLSLFRKEGLLPVDDVISDYLKLAIELNATHCAKYICSRMMGKLLVTKKGEALVAAKSFEKICDIWGFRDEYTKSLSRLKIDYLAQVREEYFRLKREMEKIVTELPVECTMLSLKTGQLPKSLLIKWALGNEIKPPTYKTEENGDGFKSIVLFNGRRYSSSVRHTNKLFAEQAAALACLSALDVLPCFNNESVNRLSL